MSRLLLLIPLLLVGCSSHTNSDLEAGLQLFRENKMVEALPLLQRAASHDAREPEALTWLAETQRRLGNRDEALKLAQQSLALEPRNSFAHLVIAETLFPYGNPQAEYDTVWYHIDRAVACDSTDGNAWQMMWAEAVFKNDLPLFNRVLRKMVETGFLTKAALAYGRWELQCLPANALLITNGDMDTFPAQAVQVTQGFRPDVAVVERGLLGTPTGRRFVRDRLGVEMPFDGAELDTLGETADATGKVRTPSDRVFAGWIEDRAGRMFSRPIALALTVERAYYEEYQQHLLNTGAFLLWQHAPVSVPIDTAAVRLSLSHIKPDNFSGPWVGENDRSPIRRVYTKYLVRNITSGAMAYAHELIKARRLTDAGDVLTWIEGFERSAELGPTFTKEIEQMRATSDLQERKE